MRMGVSLKLDWRGQNTRSLSMEGIVSFFIFFKNSFSLQSQIADCHAPLVV